MMQPRGRLNSTLAAAQTNKLDRASQRETCRRLAARANLGPGVRTRLLRQYEVATTDNGKFK